MKCPLCGFDNDRVLDSRASEDGSAIRRRRLCLSCNRRYTTYERVAAVEIKVRKKDGSRELFQPDKIRQGLQRACWKRPVSEEQIRATITAIEHHVYENHEAEIDSRVLGDIVMEHLAELDQVAYIRFASVYREFKNAHDFFDEVQPILKKKLE
jgi:transcriptional repressor NrdR